MQVDGVLSVDGGLAAGCIFLHYYTLEMIPPLLSDETSVDSMLKEGLPQGSLYYPGDTSYQLPESLVVVDRRSGRIREGDGESACIRMCDDVVIRLPPSPEHLPV